MFQPIKVRYQAKFTVGMLQLKPTVRMVGRDETVINYSQNKNRNKMKIIKIQNPQERGESHLFVGQGPVTTTHCTHCIVGVGKVFKRISVTRLRLFSLL